MEIGGKGWPEIKAALVGSATRVYIAAQTLMGSSADRDYSHETVSALDQRNVIRNHKIDGDDSEETIKVVSYNILAPTYIAYRWLRFPWATAEVLDTNHRVKRVVEELGILEPDIFGLQEVQDDVFPGLLESLEAIGYTGEYKKKTNERVDGVAIFYSTHKFRKIASRAIEFDRLAEAECKKYGVDITQLSLQQGTVGNAVLLEDKQKRLILAANVHIYYLWLRPDIQVVQAGFMMQQLKDIIEEYEEKLERPIHLIFCGDFNSVPHSTVYEYLIRGYLSDQTFEMLKEYPIFKNAPLKGISENPRKESGKRRRGENEKEENEKEDEDGFAFKEVLRHQFNLRSAYREILGQEPPYTNHVADFVGTLDYIFYGKLEREKNAKKGGEEKREREEKLEVTKIMDIVDVALVDRHIGCPNTQFPSDHMSLKAEFVLM